VSSAKAFGPRQHEPGRSPVREGGEVHQRIFSVSHRGKALFPGFQFDPDTGRPKPEVREVLEALPPSLQGWQRALWWATPSDLLGWRRPVDVLDESPELAVSAARAEAEDWKAAAGE
jgi:hypothetical protein